MGEVGRARSKTGEFPARLMMWMLIAAFLGLAHLGARFAFFIVVSAAVSVLAGLAWRLFKDREGP